MFEFAIIVLFALAISDLVVGVSNDAVNFLNSSIGSKVTSRKIIMIIASLGMLAGVTFSSGMMEVARKGIFHPQFFTMPELMTIFLAVMLTDIILLDLYNTFGLPTSTTVSIVFELLGAAVAVSLLKISALGASVGEVVNYINTSKALAIISGILLSVVVAFTIGAIVQIATRLLFTFDYQRRLKRYGALWGGAALATITYFILIKGSKGASFITPETLAWIKGHTGTILLGSFIASAIFLQLLMMLARVNALKVVVLVGTFALAMAFAANDLVNFIGVPLAGLSSYTVANATGDPLSATMEALTQPVQSNTFFLLLAGIIMVVTLWFSRKARTVTRTELRLGRQEEGYERFESSGLSRAIVRMVSSLFEITARIAPGFARSWATRRLDRSNFRPVLAADGTVPSFDLVRAAVNLMVASALISLGTSLKLPLSTTYVTFMVAMGTSFSDQAWGRDSAVYRVSGVLTVIGGWFFTAMMAFTVSAVFAVAIYFGQVLAVIAIGIIAILLLVRTRQLHSVREKEEHGARRFQPAKDHQRKGGRPHDLRAHRDLPSRDSQDPRHNDLGSLRSRPIIAQGCQRAPEGTSAVVQYHRSQYLQGPSTSRAGTRSRRDRTIRQDHQLAAGDLRERARCRPPILCPRGQSPLRTSRSAEGRTRTHARDRRRHPSPRFRNDDSTGETGSRGDRRSRQNPPRSGRGV